MASTGPEEAASVGLLKGGETTWLRYNATLDSTLGLVSIRSLETFGECGPSNSIYALDLLVHTDFYSLLVVARCFFGNFVDVDYFFSLFQISLSIPSMQCISVVGERPGMVRRLSGACAGPSVTLSVAATAHFTVSVYAT